MFNAEKFIGDALDSLLEQTFRDFEVIVVDDCSTDNSLAIVQSYAEKFGGRLKLFRLPKNSGNNGIPNNRGLALSRGQYVLFMDSDDAVTPDALEKLYDAAKIFSADVVGAERYYEVPDEFWNDKNYRRQLKPVSYQKGGFVSKPTLISADFSERVKDCYNFRFFVEHLVETDSPRLSDRKRNQHNERDGKRHAADLLFGFLGGKVRADSRHDNQANQSQH